MRCIIPGRSVKLFAKAIHCLSKIGDELYLEALSQGLALRTVNSSRSAYACFLFNESFFVSYDDGSKDLPDDSQAEDLLKCKIAMKSCLSAFKSMNTIEKTVDQCKIDLNVKEARLVFLLLCRHGITKTYNLTFQECETLQAVFSKDLSPNFITAQAKILNDTVFNFPNNQEEITLVVCPETFKVKNYVEDEPDPNKVIHTEMVLVPEEFDNYQIGVDTDVTFCLKELRAILTFAEFASQPINVHFETGGKPIVFSMDGDSTYEGDFVLATLVDQLSSSQSSQTSVTAAASTSTKKTSRDKQANRRKPAKNASQEAGILQQNSTAKQDRNTSSFNNSQRASTSQADITEHDVTGYIDVEDDDNEDDALNKTEVDQTVATRKNKKNPLSSQNIQDKRAEKTTQDSTGPGQLSSQRDRNTDANKSSVLDDFFSDSFPYQDLFTKGKAELSVIPEASQESADKSFRGSARPIQTPPSSVTDVSFLKNVDMPSLGDSGISPEVTPPRHSAQKKTRPHQKDPDESLMDVVADDDYDFIPGTPPHKKFKSMFFSASESQVCKFLRERGVQESVVEKFEEEKGVSEGVVLAADSDED